MLYALGGCTGCANLPQAAAVDSLLMLSSGSDRLRYAVGA